MIEQSPEIQSLAVALLQFQAEVRGVLKDSKNPHFKNRYASLEAVVEAARPGLQSAGIVFLQGPGNVVGNTLEVSTMLIHAASGQWIRSTMQIPMAKIDPQGAGSAVTYAQRYSLMAALGIPPVEHLDDDAETAMGRGDTNRPLDRKSAPSRAGADQAGGEASNRAVSPSAAPQQDAFGLPPIDEPTESQTRLFADLKARFEECTSVAALDEKVKKAVPEIESLTDEQKDRLRKALRFVREALRPRVVS